MRSFSYYIIIIIYVSLIKNAFAIEPLFDARIDYETRRNPRSVFSADLDGNGSYDLAVASEGNGIIDHGGVSILLNNGDGMFQQAVNYYTADVPSSVFAADLDGDGDNDLAVANSGSGNISILLNNGDGTFQSSAEYGVGVRPHSVFAIDLDGDDDNDLAIANAGAFSDTSGIVSILLNNGDGTFQTAVNYGVGALAESVFAIDLDSDGDNDLAVANNGTDDVSVLINNGDGTFLQSVDYGIGEKPTAVFLADLDGDGDNDLAVTGMVSDPVDSGYVSVLLNNGDATFQAAANYETGDCSYSVYAADLDGDGDNDLVTANAGIIAATPGTVSILLNNGDGTFEAAVDYGSANVPQSVFVADLDGDGDNDLAVANKYSRNVSVFFNYGDGTFPAAIYYGAGDHPRSVFAADFDADGANDLAVTNKYSDDVSLLLNNGDGTFREAVNYWAGDYPTSIFAVDLDSDSDNDLAIANEHSNNISVLLNNGDGTFPAPVHYEVGERPLSVFAADLNGDGLIDLVSADFDSHNISVLLNNGEGNFQDAVYYGTGYNPSSIFAIDLDGDGDNDLSIPYAGTYPDYSGAVSILLNNGDGTFQEAVDYGDLYTPTSIFAVDLDSDGDNDLALAQLVHGINVMVLMNNGDGVFQLTAGYGTGENPVSIFAADLDEDGDNDLVTANSDFTNNVSILLNNGDGTFQDEVNYGAGKYPSSVFAADLNTDGVNDLAVVNSGGSYFAGDISVLINRMDAVSVDDSPEILLPEIFRVSQNYPNPFNASTVISYELPYQSQVTIDIYDILGRKVGTLQDCIKPAGYHQVIWDAKGISSGVYFYRLQVDDYAEIKKMMLMK